MSNISLDKLIFIGGVPRSGTTLVKRLLNSHSDIYCGPEFGHLPAVMNQYNTMKKSIENGRMDEYSNLTDLQLSYQSFVLELLKKPLIPLSKTYMAEKTPGNIRVFTHLHELFPSAKLLHILRNPFDVVASFLRVGKRKNDLAEHYYDVRKGAIFWRQTINWITRFETSKEDSFQEQYKVLKYEELLTDPELILEDLLNWLGIKYEPSMLNLEEGKGEPNSFGDVFYTKEEYYKAFDSSNINKFQDVLTEEELIIIEETKCELIKFKYMTKEEIVAKLASDVNAK